jgi:hypothetical protein
MVWWIWALAAAGAGTAYVVVKRKKPKPFAAAGGSIKPPAQPLIEMAIVDKTSLTPTGVPIPTTRRTMPWEPSFRIPDNLRNKYGWVQTNPNASRSSPPNAIRNRETGDTVPFSWWGDISQGIDPEPSIITTDPDVHAVGPPPKIRDSVKRFLSYYPVVDSNGIVVDWELWRITDDGTKIDKLPKSQWQNVTEA